MIRFVREIGLNNASLLSPTPAGATGKGATWKGGGYSAAQLPKITTSFKSYYHTWPGSTDKVDCFI